MTDAERGGVDASQTMNFGWLTATTTTVTSSSSTALYGQPLTLTAAVSGSEASENGENVEFYDGQTDLGGAALSSGSASITLSTLSPGLNSITAVYGGDTTYGASTSAPFNQTVLLTGTTTSLAASTTTPVYGQPVTFSVTVGNLGAGSGTPSGDVEFYDGTTDIGSASLDDSGDASLTVSTLTAGSHSITAVYQGDGNFSASTTLPLSLPVTAVATAIELDSPTNTVAPGAPVTLDASVVAAGPGCVTPTGNVQFFDGTTCLGTAALDGWGDATLTVSTLATGAALDHSRLLRRPRFHRKHVECHPRKRCRADGDARPAERPASGQHAGGHVPVLGLALHQFVRDLGDRRHQHQQQYARHPASDRGLQRERGAVHTVDPGQSPRQDHRGRRRGHGQPRHPRFRGGSAATPITPATSSCPWS